MKIVVAIAVLSGGLVAAFPAVAQSIGGPHKTINQIGGAKPIVNPVVAPPRHAPPPTPVVLPANRSASAGPKPPVK